MDAQQFQDKLNALFGAADIKRREENYKTFAQANLDMLDQVAEYLAEEWAKAKPPIPSELKAIAHRIRKERGLISAVREGINPLSEPEIQAYADRRAKEWMKSEYGQIALSRSAGREFYCRVRDAYEADARGKRYKTQTLSEYPLVIDDAVVERCVTAQRKNLIDISHIADGELGKLSMATTDLQVDMRPVARACIAFDGELVRNFLVDLTARKQLDKWYKDLHRRLA